MIDEFGKPGAGILDGNIKWLGSYDECLNIDPVRYRVPRNKTEPYKPFETKYCIAHMSFPTELLPVKVKQIYILFLKRIHVIIEFDVATNYMKYMNTKA